MKKIQYKEGDVFSVSLKEGRFSLGVIARKPKGGKIILGYFFSLREDRSSKAQLISRLRPDEANSILIFGDPYIRTGRWAIVGKIDKWSRDLWPIPKFSSKDLISGTNYLVTYSNENLVLSERRDICTGDTSSYPQDGIGDAEFVENFLRKAALRG